MAEISVSGSGKSNKTRQKKLSTRIDLTPMVDLGFLLITFFIFTTTMSKPTAMRLILPADSADRNETKASGALTVILGDDRKTFYYEGILDADAKNVRELPFSKIRELLINKKQRTKAEDLVIVIKAYKDSNYGNAVDMLDEMKINDIKRYALVDISQEETALIQQKSH